MPVIPEETHDSPLFRMRHSLSHVLAQAVQRHYPGTLLGFGPPIDDGFYYDFILPRPITEDELPALEASMRAILVENQPFRREDLQADQAFERIKAMGEPHKYEYAQELVAKKGAVALSFYTNGPFVDMCEGPHVDNTADIPPEGFKLHSIAGAYWRGDERNTMMTRIYAYAYPTKAELDARVEAVEQAKSRDHRKLAQQLRIFTLCDEVGKGLPLWLPNGTVLRTELEKLAGEMEFKYGYQRVATPHITKAGLYETSGHLPLYQKSMYPPMRLHEDAEAGGEFAEQGEGAPERYYLKPMNCPHHHMIYAADKRSYRDLPLRLAEYGTVYRFERAGALHGITRVRGMGMNDAHIYVTREQIKDEFKRVMELHEEYYKLFEFTNYYLRLSLWDPDDQKRSEKFVNDPASWAFTEQVMQEAMEEMGLYYRLSKGEAAFYGPKVDFQFQTVLEKEFTVSTNQIDFAVPPRFNLRYTDRDGTEKTPFCIHRAPLGTHERFISFLIEHYGGAFPTWLAPVQVAILPVSEKFIDYARALRAKLRDKFVRADIDESDTVSKRIQQSAANKIPVVLVVGAREQENNSATVRRHGITEQRTMGVDTLIETITDEIRVRRHVRAW